MEAGRRESIPLNTVDAWRMFLSQQRLLRICRVLRRPQTMVRSLRRVRLARRREQVAGEIPSEEAPVPVFLFLFSS